MTKTVVIHQPDFLPYMGFFHRFLNADRWVILDNVQFVHSNRSWHNRDKIKTADGEKWITVSVQKCSRDTKIKDVLLSKDIDWQRNNLQLIEFNYKKAPFFNEIFPYISELYLYKFDALIDFNLKSIEMLMTLFDIKISSILASTLNPAGKSNYLLVDILKKESATTYLSGVGAKDYYDPKPFQDAGINVIWQDFQHPVYSQLHGEFVPYLSSIDILFNCGIEKSREIIRRC